jgi:crossover junction endodeoxyribonuclease RuvC
MTEKRVLLGLDPGLRVTGWGVITFAGNHLSGVAAGTIRPPVDVSLAERLAYLHKAVLKVVEDFRPHEAAVEETFMTRNGASTLKLGQARGVVLMTPALAGLPVAEYPANLIKKSVAGYGHADKDQMQAMIRLLLPGDLARGPDAADALAVAICHAHHSATALRVGGILAGGVR